MRFHYAGSWLRNAKPFGFQMRNSIPISLWSEGNWKLKVYFYFLLQFPRRNLQIFFHSGASDFLWQIKIFAGFFASFPTFHFTIESPFSVRAKQTSNCLCLLTHICRAQNKLIGSKSFTSNWIFEFDLIRIFRKLFDTPSERKGAFAGEMNE